MAEVTVSQQTMVYPAKTARKGFAYSPGIDQSFDGHCRGSLEFAALPKAAALAFSCQHAFAPVYEFPGKTGKAIL